MKQNLSPNSHLTNAANIIIHDFKTPDKLIDFLADALSFW